MKQAAFQALLNRYLAGECTAQEARQVEEWYEALHEGQPFQLRAAEQELLQQALWARVVAKGRVAPARPAAAKAIRWRPAPALQWAAAALVVLGLGLGLLLLRPAPAPATWATRTNATGHAQGFGLPDGSRVALQPGSTLRYAPHLAGPRREIYLVGEAAFDVAHNPARPFLVYTDRVVTTVLGTCFSVRAYPGQPGALVQVRRGKVRVSERAAGAAPTFGNAEANPTSVVLLPNQQATYSPRARKLHKTLVDQPVLLGASPRLFRNEPVAELLAALGKAYGVAIVYDAAALKNCTVNMAFNEETLYQRLDILCKALGASYERTDEQIIFRSAGCAGKQ